MSVFSVSDEEWRGFYSDQWHRQLEVWEGLERQRLDIFEKFYWSADIENFVHDSVAAGFNPGEDLDLVIRSNPSRDLDVLLHNIRFFLGWIVEDEEARLPLMKSDVCRSLDVYVAKRLRSVGKKNYRGMDPSVQAGLFKYILGDRYKNNECCSFYVNREVQRLSLIIEPEEIFCGLTDALGYALFSPRKVIGSFFSVYLVDYWLSLLECIDPNLCFDTVLNIGRETAGGASATRLQIETRSFLALNEGVDVCGFEADEIVSRSPELSDRIAEAFYDWAGSERYKRLIDFIHEHGEEAPFESD